MACGKSHRVGRNGDARGSRDCLRTGAHDGAGAPPGRNRDLEPGSNEARSVSGGRQRRDAARLVEGNARGEASPAGGWDVRCYADRCRVRPAH